MFDKIFFILSMILVFYISVKSIQSFTVNFEALEEIIREFKSGYLEDIVLVNTTKCPDNYSPLSASGYNWPGNFNGCGCKESNGNYTFYKDTCPVKKDCKKIEETNEIELSRWRNNLICYRLAKTTYDKLNLIKEEDKSLCNNSTHKICGVIDSLKNLLCVKRNQTCPITEIRFYSQKIIAEDKKGTFKNGNNETSNNLNPNITLQNSNSTNNQSSKTNLYFVESRKLELAYPSYNKSIILYEEKNNLNVSETIQWLLFLSNRDLNSASYSKDNNIHIFFRVGSSSPCLNKMRNPSSENFFPLMKNKYNLMCDKDAAGIEILDSSFTEMDEYPLDKYYSDNKFNIHSIIDPFQINIIDKKIKLYSKGYSGWNLNCQNENEDSLNAFYGLSIELNRVFISIIIHSLICISVIISIGVVALYVTQYFELVFKAINLGFIIFNLIYAIQIISNSNWVVNIMSDENGLLCGDENLNYLLSEISSACLGLQYSFIIILLVSIFSFIIFIYVLYLMIKPAAREVQEKLIQMR
jgi:hypothetical protein